MDELLRAAGEEVPVHVSVAEACAAAGVHHAGDTMTDRYADGMDPPPRVAFWGLPAGPFAIAARLPKPAAGAHRTTPQRTRNSQGPDAAC